MNLEISNLENLTAKEKRFFKIFFGILSDIDMLKLNKEDIARELEHYTSNETFNSSLERAISRLKITEVAEFRVLLNNYLLSLHDGFNASKIAELEHEKTIHENKVVEISRQIEDLTV